MYLDTIVTMAMMVVMYAVLCIAVGGLGKLAGSDFRTGVLMAAFVSPALAVVFLFVAILIVNPSKTEERKATGS